MADKVVENRLAICRQRRGLSAAALAKSAGVSRQTIYAIESGSYVPNTAVALRLARVLETGVEEIFSLRDAPSSPQISEKVTLLPHAERARAGDPVRLCRVDRHMIATLAAPVPWWLPTADGALDRADRSGKATARLFDAESGAGNAILVAGCDPGISVLARHLQRGGVELVVAQRNSSQALELLKRGVIHVAGTHLRDDASGESNLPAIQRLFARNSVAVISLALWEAGIVVARGNPKAIHSIADFARPDVGIVNREAGAGSRLLLDEHLRKLGLGRAQVHGYQRIAGGHLPASWEVRAGEADACIATRASARVFGLDFIPLASERYDLAIRRQHLDHPPIQALLDTLSRGAYRRELEGLGGYDANSAGRRLL